MKGALGALCIAMLFCAMVAFAQKSGEIIFSKSMINPASPAGSVTEFSTGDRIYAMAFFDKPIVEMSRDESPKKIDAGVFLYELKPPLYSYQQPSENQLEFATLWVSGDALQNKYLPLDIVPAPDAMTAYGSKNLMYEKFGPKFFGPVKFAEAIGKFAAGDQTIIVKVRINYQDVAEGKFVIKGSDYAVYKKYAAELNESASNLKTKDAVMPKAARTDKSMEADMIRALKASQTYKDRIKGEVLRVVIVDPDWMIRRNELTGVILHRYIRSTIAVKNSDGTCTVWQLVTFQQDYVGNKFQATRFDGVGDPFKIPCENVNK